MLPATPASTRTSRASGPRPPKQRQDQRRNEVQCAAAVPRPRPSPGGGSAYPPPRCPPIPGQSRSKNIPNSLYFFAWILGFWWSRGVSGGSRRDPGPCWGPLGPTWGVSSHELQVAEPLLFCRVCGHYSPHSRYVGPLTELCTGPPAQRSSAQKRLKRLTESREHPETRAELGPVVSIPPGLRS